jgi:very-short-patch-repair endonuclease
MSTIPFERSFASHPKAQYWSEKNEISPREISLNSNKKFWFNCNCNHEIEMQLNVVNRGAWCYYCSGHKICNNTNCKSCFEKSFASHEKSQYWSEKNELKPRDVFKSSRSVYLFNCVCGHEFEKVLYSTGWCPYCSKPHKKLCNNEECKQCFDKSFASYEDKDILNRWSKMNKDKDGKIITPRDIFKVSGVKYLFDCNICLHSFETTPAHLKENKGCIYCANQKLCNDINCKICFEKSFASHPKSQYWSDKNELKPRDVFKVSGKSYIFDCICGHQFEKKLNNVSKDTWCPYCVNKKLCNIINCKSCFEKSFASHEKSQFWSDKNELKPREVFKSSGIKYIFNCSCNHEFEKCLDSINSGGWCIYCAGQMICNDINCKSCFEKSFASHEKSKYWSEKNKNEEGNIISPRDVHRSSGDKYIFNCYCGHTFSSALSSISNGTWCPYCCNPSKQLCDNDNCQSCFEKSFSSHPKSQYWSDKNELKPRDVFKRSSTNKYIFNCEKGHEFENSTSNISINVWCSKCKNKTEEKLLTILQIEYPHVRHQFREEWCKNPITNKHLPFDFVLEKEKIIIELDGRQHFTQVSNWSTPEEQYKRDTYKMECANQNGYSVIRITQEDVYDDTFDWYKMLKESIETIIQKESVENHYISYEDDYIHFN